MSKPYDDSANLLKAGLGPPIPGRPVPTADDQTNGRKHCKAMHPMEPDLEHPNWYPSGCNCGTIAQLLADTRDAGRAEGYDEALVRVVEVFNRHLSKLVPIEVERAIRLLAFDLPQRKGLK